MQEITGGDFINISDRVSKKISYNDLYGTFYEPEQC